MERVKALWARLAYPLAIASLALAFVIGQIASQRDFKALLQAELPNNTLKLVEEAEGGQIVFFDDSEQNYLIISEAEGYGGPLTVAIRAHDDGRLVEILSLQHKETLAFFNKVKKRQFFRQFGGMKVSDEFLLGVDIDAVSGATITSMGYTSAVRKAMHIAATKHFKLEQTWQNPGWKFGHEELGLLGVFALAFLVTYMKGPVSKYGKLLMPIAALGFVGFYTNTSVSIGQIGGILLGYVPDIRSHMLWWIMMTGALGAVLLLGRNIYCAQVCPFQYIERGLNKISGVNLAIRPSFQRSARTVVRWLTWTALMLIFLSAHPTLGSFEPFALAFSLTGLGVQWYILPLSLIGSFFVLNFWCRLFCPVGIVMNDLVRWRKSALGRLKKRPKPQVIPAQELSEDQALSEDKGDLWRNES